MNHFTRHPPGTKESPLDTAGVNAKVRDLMAPVLGAQKTEALINQINTLETLDDIRKLRPLLTRSSVQEVDADLRAVVPEQDRHDVAGRDRHGLGKRCTMCVQWPL